MENMAINGMADFEVGCSWWSENSGFLCVVERTPQVREEKRGEEGFCYEDFKRRWF